VVRFPYEGSFVGRLTRAIDESTFISSCNMIDRKVQDLLVLAIKKFQSCPELIDSSTLLTRRIFFRSFIRLHFPGLSRVISYHIPILLHVDDLPNAKRPFNFENVWLEVVPSLRKVGGMSLISLNPLVSFWLRN